VNSLELATADELVNRASAYAKHASSDGDLDEHRLSLLKVHTDQSDSAADFPTTNCEPQHTLSISQRTSATDRVPRSCVDVRLHMVQAL
jgi:hypothetical protein